MAPSLSRQSQFKDRLQTGDGTRVRIEFEIARYKDWCLENEEPWLPRWTEPAPEPPQP